MIFAYLRAAIWQRIGNFSLFAPSKEVGDVIFNIMRSFLKINVLHQGSEQISLILSCLLVEWGKNVPTLSVFFKGFLQSFEVGLWDYQDIYLRCLISEQLDNFPINFKWALNKIDKPASKPVTHSFIFLWVPPSPKEN